MDCALVAPLLFAGTCNTLLFNAWVEHALCPLLNDTQAVVMDNVPFHKSAQTHDRVTGTDSIPHLFWHKSGSQLTNLSLCFQSASNG
jgi:hypothetical protein